MAIDAGFGLGLAGSRIARMGRRGDQRARGDQQEKRKFVGHEKPSVWLAPCSALRIKSIVAMKYTSNFPVRQQRTPRHSVAKFIQNHGFSRLFPALRWRTAPARMRANTYPAAHKRRGRFILLKSCHPLIHGH
jgi:hypothetical protein